MPDIAYGMCLSKRHGAAEVGGCSCPKYQDNEHVHIAEMSIKCVGDALAEDEEGGVYRKYWKYPGEEHCSAVVPGVVSDIQNICEEKGYKNGILVKNVRCYVGPTDSDITRGAPNSKSKFVAIASYLCKGR